MRRNSPDHGRPYVFPLHLCQAQLHPPRCLDASSDHHDLALNLLTSLWPPFSSSYSFFHSHVCRVRRCAMFCSSLLLYRCPCLHLESDLPRLSFSLFRILLLIHLRPSLSFCVSLRVHANFIHHLSRWILQPFVSSSRFAVVMLHDWALDRIPTPSNGCCWSEAGTGLLNTHTADLERKVPNSITSAQASQLYIPQIPGLLAFTNQCLNTLDTKGHRLPFCGLRDAAGHVTVQPPLQCP